MLLNNAGHLIQFIDVGLDVLDPARVIPLTMCDLDPLRLQNSLLDFMGKHNRPIYDAADPTELLA